MAFIRPAYRRLERPNGLVDPNLASPLLLGAVSLIGFNEGGGFPRDLLTGAVAVAGPVGSAGAGTAPAWGVSQPGVGRRTYGNTNFGLGRGDAFADADVYDVGTGDFTLFAAFTCTRAVAQLGGVVGKANQSSLVGYAIGVNTFDSGDGVVFGLFRDGDTAGDVNSGAVAVAANKLATVALSRQAGIGYLYVNGALAATGAASGNLSNASRLQIGAIQEDGTNSQFYHDGSIFTVGLIKGQPWRQAEAAEFAEAPFSIYRPLPRRSIFRVAAGGGPAAHELAGQVTLTLQPAAGMDATRHRSLGGAVSTALTPAAAMAYSRHRALAGAVTTTLVPAATLDLTRHRSLSGAVTLSLIPAAGMDATRHAGLSGQVTLVLTPGAAMDFTGQRSLDGSVTLNLSPAAAFDFTRHAALGGAVTLNLIPQAQFGAGQHPVLAGAVTLSLTPAAALAFARHFAIAGACQIALTPAAAMDQRRHAGLNGNVTLTLTASGTFDVTRHRSLGGAVTLSLIPAAGMDFSRPPTLPGLRVVSRRPPTRVVSRRPDRSVSSRN